MRNKIDFIKEKVFLYKYYIYMFIILILIIILSLFIYLYFNKDNNINTNTSNIVLDDSNLDNKDDSKENSNCLISVDIKGYIKNPGMYSVSCDFRVNDLIEYAGGILENGDTSVLNLSKKLSDEMVIYIYSKEDVNNFTKVKESEIEKNNNCNNYNNIRNDVCITEDKVVETIYINDINNYKNSNEIKTNNDTKMDTSHEKNNDLININTADINLLTTLPGIGESKAKKIIEYRNDTGLFKTIDDIKNVSGIGDKMFEKIKSNITV